MKTATQMVILTSMLLAVACGSNGAPQSEPEKGASTGRVAGETPKVPTRDEPRDAGVAIANTPAALEAPEGMLPVPGGTFVMGLDDPRAIPDERHEHQVTVKSFLLDRTEVSNAAYEECVTTGVCNKPEWKDTGKSGFEPLEAFRTPDRPVSAISQTDAATYCKWRGKRLPTEAEFERAARGDDGRMYAWGDQEPDPDLAVFGLKVTGPVGSKPQGSGPYGHLDLAGNVWEWTSDLYDPYAYRRKTASSGTPGTCPQIKAAQDEIRQKGPKGFTGWNPIPKDCDHALRGGAFNYFPWGLRASNRVHHPGSWRMIMSGFRCAMDMTPTRDSE